MSGLGYDVNYAEARGDDEPCSYRLPHSFLKISNDPWKCEKVDYWVPEKCGIKAGLYKTDTTCQPPPAAAEPAPVPTKPAEPTPFTQEEQLESEQKSSVQKNSDSMFLEIMAGIIILGIIGIGILFARKILGGSGGGSDGGYDDRRRVMGTFQPPPPPPPPRHMRGLNAIHHEGSLLDGGSDDGEYDDSGSGYRGESERYNKRLDKERRDVERDEALEEELNIIRGKLANNRDWIVDNENCHSSDCDRDREWHEDKIFDLEHRLEQIRQEKERKERKAFEDDDYD